MTYFEVIKMPDGLWKFLVAYVTAPSEDGIGLKKVMLAGDDPISVEACGLWKLGQASKQLEKMESWNTFGSGETVTFPFISSIKLDLS